MITINTRIILWCVAVCGLTLAAFSIAIYHGSRRSELATLDARLLAHATAIRAELEEEEKDQPGVTDEQLHDIKAIQTGGLSEIHIQVFDKTGSRLAMDSALGLADAGQLQKSLKGGIEFTTIAGNRSFRCAYVPIERHDRIDLVVQIGASNSEMQKHLGQLFLQMIIGIPSCLIFISLAVFLIIRRSLKPIRRMIRSSAAISAGNLTERIRVPAARDEIRLLAETLNSMLDRISAAFDGQRQFIADASHEIRTPLTVVRSELEFALRSSLPESAEESIRISLGEAEHLTRLAGNLLTLARADTAQLALSREHVRLDELVVECVQSVRTIADEKKIAIAVEIGDAIEISADKERMKSVIINLLDNAVKYSRPGDPVNVSLRKDGLNALLTVKDAGRGIDAADVPHVFDRFYRSASARSQGEGCGLGLAIARTITELHGGTITVQSTLGHGSVFTVTLPISIAN
jgi:two-component system, OmpR family, sensor kinase